MKTVFETENYAIIKNEKRGMFELVRKVWGRTLFMNESKFQTPLIVAARKLGERH